MWGGSESAAPPSPTSIQKCEGARAVTGTTDARTRILDAAERLFAARGFDATATSLIAKTAAVPKGLLFYYFPAKLDILSTLLGERLEAAIDAGPLAVPGNPVRALLNISETLFRAQSESEVLRVIVWREERTHPEVRKALAAHRRALHDSIEQVLAASLRVPVAARRLRAAALAWGAIVTARPLASEMYGETDASNGASGDTRDEAAGFGDGDQHSSEDLIPLAELVCSGLQQPLAAIG